jgi:hypothetical protein
LFGPRSERKRRTWAIEESRPVPESLLRGSFYSVAPTQTKTGRFEGVSSSAPFVVHNPGFDSVAALAIEQSPETFVGGERWDRRGREWRERVGGESGGGESGEGEVRHSTNLNLGNKTTLKRMATKIQQPDLETKNQ